MTTNELYVNSVLVITYVIQSLEHAWDIRIKESKHTNQGSHEVPQRKYRIIIKM